MIYFIKESKEKLEARLNKIDEKISQVETSIDEKTQFIIDKIIDINPGRDVVKNTVLQLKSENHVKISNIEIRLRELKNTLDRLESSCTTDLTNFKKILVKFRAEIDQLNSFAKEGTNGGSSKTGSG